MGKYLTTQEFIIRAKSVHGDKYDYCLVNYIDSKTKVKIICKKHNIFEQSPNSHLNGNGCNKCTLEWLSDKFSYSTDDFVRLSRELFGDRYDYSLVNYINNRTPVMITCPHHGQFLKRPDKHLRGQGCPRCALIKRVKSSTYTVDDFIKLANEVHGNKYDYSLVSYRNGQTKVDIICPEGHIFSQRPAIHLYGQGCLKCYQSQWDKDAFIQKVSSIHNGKYDYSRIEYINGKAKVEIVCPFHGSFWQRASAHQDGQGCPVCRISSGEREIERVLQRLQIEYSKQKCFEGCMLRFHLPFDFHFVIGNHAFLVEYDGEQHFGPISFYGGKQQYELRKKRDAIKTAFAAANGFILIRIPYTDFDNIETILKTEIEKHTKCP